MNCRIIDTLYSVTTIDSNFIGGFLMSGTKAILIEKINRMPDELDEFEIVKRLLVLSRIEHSRQRCESEGTLSDMDVSKYFKQKKAMYEVG